MCNLEKEVCIFESKYRKFPVFFPVSREFGRRRVRARLGAPPRSLKCRGTLPCFGRNEPKLLVVRANSQADRIAENGQPRTVAQRIPPYSPDQWSDFLSSPRRSKRSQTECLAPGVHRVGIASYCLMSLPIRVCASCRFQPNVQPLPWIDLFRLDSAFEHS
jgi:hypothetical protein